MYGPRDYHTKWSQSGREQQTIKCHLYMKSKIWYKLIYKRETDRYRKQIYQWTKGWGRGN